MARSSGLGVGVQRSELGAGGLGLGARTSGLGSRALESVGAELGQAKVQAGSGPGSAVALPVHTALEAQADVSDIEVSSTCPSTMDLEADEAEPEYRIE